MNAKMVFNKKIFKLTIMKKYLQIQVLLITSIAFQMLLTNCNTRNSDRTNNSETKNDFIEINIDELDLKDSVLFSTFFSGVKVIPLETNKNCLIGRIEDIVIENDTLYVLDRLNAKSLFVFDFEGNFIRKIGNTGKGPGEYVRPQSFTVDTKNNQIHIVDNGNKILTYTLNGKFIKEVNPEFENSFISSIKNMNGINYVDHMIYNSEESSFYVSSIDNSGNIINQWLPSHIYSNGFTSLSGTVNQLVKTNNDIKYMRPYMDTIFTIQPGNKIKPFMHLSTQNKITKNEMDQLNMVDLTNREEMEKLTSNKYFKGVSNYIESPELIMFNFNFEYTHTLFYSPNTKEYICTNSRFIDDLARVKYILRFYCSYKNYFVTAVDQNLGFLSTLIDNLNNGNVNPINKNQIDLEKLNENSNPVVILYECKESF